MAKPRVGAAQFTKKTNGPVAYQQTANYGSARTSIPENSNNPRTSIPENSNPQPTNPTNPPKMQIPENSNKPRTSIPENTFGNPVSAADAIFTTRRVNRKKKGPTAERMDAVRRRMQNG